MLTLGRWEARALWPVTSIGKLSFGLYVFHPITRTWVDKLLPTSALPEGSAPRAVVLLAVWIAVTTVLAAVSYQFFEEPILSAARRKSKRILQPPAEANPGAAAPGRLAEGELSAGVAGPPAS
jgi:peptidoglycan/LPS O-acetylase OafA/YrhL